jgi:plastocyanin
MRTVVVALSTILIMMTLAACTVSREDADDDTVAADATETPVMDTQQTDDATDDSAVDDADITDDAADDSAVDDAAVDDATDDSDVDDATDDSAVDDAVDDATDDATDDTATDDDDVVEPAEHIIEIIEGNEFSPAEITIAPGDTVTWVNTTDQVHTSSADPEIATDQNNVQLPEGADTWHSGNIEPGEEYSVTLDVPGMYVYFCYPHQDGGMIGVIIVEDETDDVDRDDADAVDDDATDDVEAVDDDATDEVDAVDDDVTDDDDVGDVEVADDDETEEPYGVGGDRDYNGKDSVN